MVSPTNHPVVQDMDGWMRRQEKTVLREQRRPRVTNAADIMGPGIAPRAVEINDWSGEETEFNGFFYSQPGALHSPGASDWWLGWSLTQIEGFGIQQVWDYRGTTSPVVTYTRRFSSVGGQRVFSPWA